MRLFYRRRIETRLSSFFDHRTPKGNKTDLSISVLNGVQHRLVGAKLARAKTGPPWALSCLPRRSSTEQRGIVIRLNPASDYLRSGYCAQQILFFPAFFALYIFLSALLINADVSSPAMYCATPMLTVTFRSSSS